jgi:hypothetical protein
MKLDVKLPNGTLEWKSRRDPKMAISAAVERDIELNDSKSRYCIRLRWCEAKSWSMFAQITGTDHLPFMYSCSAQNPRICRPDRVSEAEWQLLLPLTS